MNIFRALTTLPRLLADANLLQAEAGTAQADPDVQAELANAPHLSAMVSQLSAEWRAVETDATKVKKSHFWNFFSAVSRLGQDAKSLEKAVDHAGVDPDILSELDRSPKTKAHVLAISAEWRTVETDFQALK